jgi:hypothetical protein
LAIHLFHLGFAFNEEQNLLVLTDVRARRGQEKGAWIRSVKGTRRVTRVKGSAIRKCVEDLQIPILSKSDGAKLSASPVCRIRNFEFRCLDFDEAEYHRSQDDSCDPN